MFHQFSLWFSKKRGERQHEFSSCEVYDCSKIRSSCLENWKCTELPRIYFRSFTCCLKMSSCICIVFLMDSMFWISSFLSIGSSSCSSSRKLWIPLFSTLPSDLRSPFCDFWQSSANFKENVLVLLLLLLLPTGEFASKLTAHSNLVPIPGNRGCRVGVKETFQNNHLLKRERAKSNFPGTYPREKKKGNF